MSGTHLFYHLARAFSQEGVRHCFALLGDANMNWAAALADLGCEFTYVRDEHCAVAASMSWARVTGEVGVATVTCGPGVTQILTALPAAVRASIPLVIFAGEAPLSKSWYNQKIDQRPLVEACGAIYVPLHYPDTMFTQIRDAFLSAKIHQQPVVLGVPFDLQEKSWNSTQVLPEPSDQFLPTNTPAPPNVSELDSAIDLLCNASKIIVMAGRGALLSGATDACKQLAETLGALLATSLPARGAFHDEPFSIGIAGGFSTNTARRCLQEADLVIAIGCSLAQHNSDAGKLFKARQVLHIDVEPLSISQGRPAADYHLRCDARLGVEALLSGLQNKQTTRAETARRTIWRTPALADEIKNAPADDAHFDIAPGLHDPRTVVQQLEAALPDEWFMVNSSGHCSYFFAQMPSRSAEHFLTIREFGAIGNGIAFAIGVARAHPNKTVVLFDGDGSLLMHVQELETIARHQLNILICVLNDGAYGSEIHKLRAEGLNEDGAVFGYSNFADIAAGFGVDGVQVKELDSLPSQVQALTHRGGPAVWDFHVSDQVVSPVIRRSHQS